VLLRLYTSSTDSASTVPQKDLETARTNGHAANGSTVMPNGHARQQPFSDRDERQRLRDAEEFELEGLMSDEDEATAKERLGTRS